ncbi:hypothetical protein ACB098_11G137200 [Castanea mollissima]
MELGMMIRALYPSNMPWIQVQKSTSPKLGSLSLLITSPRPYRNRSRAHTTFLAQSTQGASQMTASPKESALFSAERKLCRRKPKPLLSIVAHCNYFLPEFS